MIINKYKRVSCEEITLNEISFIAQDGAYPTDILCLRGSGSVYSGSKTTQTSTLSLPYDGTITDISTLTQDTINLIYLNSQGGTITIYKDGTQVYTNTAPTAGLYIILEQGNYTATFNYDGARDLIKWDTSNWIKTDLTENSAKTINYLVGHNISVYAIGTFRKEIGTAITANTDIVSFVDVVE
ncbi:hypothetical protein [Methanococcus voltae]|uniref:Uncharacterized protein n=1 Tax=Methanococcus voltae (strain ATCC BAA-1334 / A3) TaxID=456320 RepID=D7DSK6_METV3|nr:hypothetical protein [Methanococcus voltae]MCS3901715.1 hypothetical protein [Methanococcus voltae]